MSGQYQTFLSDGFTTLDRLLSQTFKDIISFLIYDFPPIKVRPSLRDSAFSLRFPAENFRTAKFSAGKTLRKRRDGRKRDSEGENCDRRSACATRKRTVREPLFMPYPGMRPLSSPAVVKALLLPLHCICGLFCPYPRPPVLPALSLRKTAYRNGWRDTDFSGYGGTFRKKEWKTGYYLAV